jgi:hypothetical protein
MLGGFYQYPSVNPATKSYYNANKQLCLTIANKIIDNKEGGDALKVCTLEAITDYLDFINKNKISGKDSGKERVKQLQNELNKNPNNYKAMIKVLSEGNEEPSSFKTFLYDSIIKKFLNDEQKKQLSTNFKTIRALNDQYGVEIYNLYLVRNFLWNILAKVEESAKVVSVELVSISSHSKGP